MDSCTQALSREFPSKCIYIASSLAIKLVFFFFVILFAVLNSRPLLSSEAIPHHKFIEIPGADSIVQSSQELVVLDPGIAVDNVDFSDLFDLNDPHFEVLILNEQLSGVDQITEHLLRSKELYSAVHVVAHGSDGELELGKDSVTQTNLSVFQADLQKWSGALSEQADLLIYACELAQTPHGISFVEKLAEFTGADVAASDNLTGSSDLGGDWNLEVAVGHIQTVALHSETYDSVLDLRPTVDLDQDDSGVNPGNFPVASVSQSDPTRYTGTLGDGSTVSANFVANSSLNVGVSAAITVNLASGNDNAFELVLEDDAISLEDDEAIRIVTNITPSVNSQWVDLTLRQSPNQDLKAGSLTLFFADNATLIDPDNQISNEVDGEELENGDSLIFATPLSGADATWSVVFVDPLRNGNTLGDVEYIFTGANDGTPFGTPGFEMEVGLNPIGYSTTYVENDQPISVVDDIELTHVDGGDLAQLRIALGGAVDGSEEELTIAGVTWAVDDERADDISVLGTDLRVARDPDNLTFLISNPAGRVTLLEAQAVFESVRYFHTSEHPAAGIRSISFRTLDRVNNNSRDFSYVAQSRVTVVPVNDPPVAVDDGEVLVVAGVPDVVDPIANDIDVDLDNLSILGVPTAAQGTVSVQTDNTLVYTPAADFSGTDTITYTVVDPAGATSTATLVVSDSAINVEPTAGVDQSIASFKIHLAVFSDLMEMT